MTNEELDGILKARSELISFYAMLRGGGSPLTAVVKQADVAAMIEVAVKNLDASLKGHVNFGPGQK